MRALRSRGRGGAVRGVRSRASEPWTLVTGVGRAQRDHPCRVGRRVAHHRSPSWWVGGCGACRAGAAPGRGGSGRGRRRRRRGWPARSRATAPRASPRPGGRARWRRASRRGVRRRCRRPVGRSAAAVRWRGATARSGSDEPGEELAAVAAGGERRDARCRDHDATPHASSTRRRVAPPVRGPPAEQAEHGRRRDQPQPGERERERRSRRPRRRGRRRRRCPTPVRAAATSAGTAAARRPRRQR